MLRAIAFITRQDLLNNLRQRETLFWLFVMPPIFIGFIGSATGGFGGSSGDEPDPLIVLDDGTGGPLVDQFAHQLERSDFAVTRRSESSPETDEDANAAERTDRSLIIPERFSETVLAGGEVELILAADASPIGGDYDGFRVKRAAITMLADLAAVRAGGSGDVGSTPALAGDFRALNAAKRSIVVDVSPAGERATVPNGFEQAVPGNLVMFTMLVLLTSGAFLVVERKEGLLRRLASAPITRSQIVGGKWLARLLLATIQITYAMILGTLFFDMDWGPALPMVFAVLVGWAALCASAAFLLGSLATTEGQAVGIGVFTSMVLASLGGCWWPIEITPEWMQGLQLALPSGWAMDALHSLVSFRSGAASVLPQLAALWIGALVIGVVAVKRFRYQ